MLTPKEYAFVEGDTAAAIGLEPDHEYGLLMCEDEHGRQATVAGDANYTRMIRDAPHHVLANVKIPADQFPLQRDGWPPSWDAVE